MGASGSRLDGSTACTSSLPPGCGWSRNRRTAAASIDSDPTIFNLMVESSELVEERPEAMDAIFAALSHRSAGRWWAGSPGGPSSRLRSASSPHRCRCRSRPCPSTSGCSNGRASWTAPSRAAVTSAGSSRDRSRPRRMAALLRALTGRRAWLARRPAPARWRASDRPRHRARIGLTSSTGVPSTASRSRTRTALPSTATTSTRWRPIGFGRSGERVANTPISGRSVSPRG